jgi:hypothetical protein
LVVPAPLGDEAPVCEHSVDGGGGVVVDDEHVPLGNLNHHVERGRA